jgi:hypothetical protein
MQRKQIRFGRQQIADIRKEARRRNVSDAAVVRQAVDRLLAGPSQNGRPRPGPDVIARALGVVGRFGSDPHDISIEHDRELADIFRE